MGLGIYLSIYVVYAIVQYASGYLDFCDIPEYKYKLCIFKNKIFLIVLYLQTGSAQLSGIDCIQSKAQSPLVFFSQTDPALGCELWLWELDP